LGTCNEFRNFGRVLNFFASKTGFNISRNQILCRGNEILLRIIFWYKIF